MAKFQLYLLTFKDKADEISFSPSYLITPISEFQSKIITNKYNNKKSDYTYSLDNNFCYTYDEQLSLHQNSQKELTFKMDLKVYREDRLEENPFTKSLVIGSQLLLVDAYNNHHLFTVKSIDISLLNVNTTNTYTCQDTFNFQLSRQNDGYTITNNIEDEDFIGAHTIDWWVQEKIVPECLIYYQYETLAVHGYKDDYYRQTLPFSGSGTAASILIDLGSLLDLQLKVYEHYNQDNGDLIQKFWFEPQKKPEVSGLKYSPYIDLQEMSLTHKGDSLTSVLNVYGGTVAEEQITLLPEIPQLFKQVFASEEWNKSTYYSGIFNDICYGQTFKINLDDLNLKSTYDQTNKLLYIPLDSILSLKNINWLSYYDQFSFNDNIRNSGEIFKWSEISYTYQEEKTKTFMTQIESAAWRDWKLYKGQEIFTSLRDFKKYDSNSWGIVVPIVQDLYRVDEKVDYEIYGTIYISFTRQPVIEETTFTYIVENCPWLENKLIDFSYFIQHNLLNHYEYQVLINQIYNNLRVVNGQLLYLADAYYKALSEKTIFLAELDTRVTNLGAKFQASFLKPYLNQKNIQTTDAQDFLLDYTNLYTDPDSKRHLFEFDKIYSDYLNKYFNAEQKFLKNIYNFREYWDASVSIAGQTKLQEYQLKINNANYSFDGTRFSTKTLRRDIDYNYNTGKWKEEEVITLYDKDNQKISTLVNSSNYQNFLWAITPENDFTPCSAKNQNNKYDSEKQYYKRIDKDTYEPVDFKEMKKQYLLSHNSGYYFRNTANYISKWKTAQEIDSYMKNFSKIVYRKLFNENFVEEQFSFTKDEIKKAIDRNELNAEMRNFLYFSNFPLQEVYVEDYVYKLEGETYKKDGNKKKYQVLPLVTPLNYMNYYRRISLSAEEYKTSIGLAIGGSVVGTTATVIGMATGPIGWIVGGLVAAASFTTATIAAFRFTSQDTTWDTSGYSYYSINFKSLGQWINNYIPWEKFSSNNSTVSITATDFYYIKEKNSYDNYISLKNNSVEGDPQHEDHYFNKWSQFLPSYYNISETGINNKPTYNYLSYNLRPLKLNDQVNPSDKYLMLLYSTKENSAWQYFATSNHLFEDIYDGSLINANTDFVLEVLSDEINFSDIAATKDTTLREALKKSFYLDEDLSKTYSIKLKETATPTDDLYLIIFHQEKYVQEQTATGVEDIKKQLEDYKYQFYNKNNDSLFSPMAVEDFTNGFYLRVEEEDLNNLTTATQFNNLRNYYDLDTKKQCFTIYQLSQMSNYFYRKNETVHNLIEKIDLETYNYSVYNNITQQFESKKFELTKGSDFQLQKKGSEIDLTQYNNGYFWYLYHNSNEESLSFLTEQAVIIETNLTTYWNQAYNASQLCQYFLPEHWQNVINNEKNIFYSSLFCSGLDNQKIILDFFVFQSTEDITDENLLSFVYNFNESTHSFVYNSEYYIVQKDGNKYSWLSFTDWTTIFAYISLDYTNKYIQVNWYPVNKDDEEGTWILDTTNIKTQLYNKDLQPISVIQKHITILPQYIPEVEKITNNKNPYSFKLKYISDINQLSSYIADYNLELLDQNQNDDNYQIVLLSTYQDQPPFDNLIQKFNLDATKWLLIPQYENKDCYFQRKTGGTTWQDLLQNLYPSKGKFPYFDGYYGLYLNYLRPENFINGTMSEYNKALKQHQEIWRNLYQHFPSILLENKYENTDATSSMELLKVAKLAMRDYNDIEREYNVTTIDASALQEYQGQEIKIGDAIALNADELYDGYDDIKESLQQFLFVTDISYTLRQDTDISLTVNKIKYQDKMIQQLAKLIR